MKLIYSPERDQILLELEYPNEQWRRDGHGEYILRVSIATTPVQYIKYYRIGYL